MSTHVCKSTYDAIGHFIWYHQTFADRKTLLDVRTLILKTTLWQRENYCYHLQMRKVKHKELVGHVVRLVHLLKQPPNISALIL